MNLGADFSSKFPEILGFFAVFSMISLNPPSRALSIGIQHTVVGSRSYVRAIAFDFLVTVNKQRLATPDLCHFVKKNREIWILCIRFFHQYFNSSFKNISGISNAFSTLVSKTLRNKGVKRSNAKIPPFFRHLRWANF